MPTGPAADTRNDAGAIARRIRELRLMRGWSQGDLARPRYTAAYISALEGGKTRASIDALTHIAGRLGITPSDLMGGAPADIALSAAMVARLAAAEEALLEAAAALRDMREALLAPRGARHLAVGSPPPRRRPGHGRRIGPEAT